MFTRFALPARLVTMVVYPVNRPYNYLSGLLAASQPGVVESTVPMLTITNPPGTTASATINLSGTASDNMAMRYVTWSSDRGGNGVAKMTWEYTFNTSSTTYTPKFMNWTIDDIGLQNGVNNITVTVMDIKGLATTQIFTVTKQ